MAPFVPGQQRNLRHERMNSFKVSQPFKTIFWKGMNSIIETYEATFNTYFFQKPFQPTI